jgi:tripeptide aminopeptidase
MDNDIIKRMIDLAVMIQQVPAPTLAERKRAEFVHEKFLSEGLEDVEIDQVNNVFARLQGKGNRPPVVVSAHLDTVFPLDTDLSLVKREGYIRGPGIGDNSLGVSGLFGLLWSIKKGRRALPGDLWLVANSCEEGLGDLKGMQAVVDRFRDEPLGYIVVEGMALGQIYHQGLDVQRYRIEIQTAGGHSWVDYGKPSAIHILAGLISRLAAIPLPTSPRTTLNVGVIQGGTSVNTIAARAHIELDLRSEDGPILDSLVGKVRELVEELKSDKVEAKMDLIGRRPAGKISRNHPLVRLAVSSLESVGIKPHFNTGSTDANIPLSRGLPAVCLGLTSGCGAHTLSESIWVEPASKGLEQLVRLVRGVFKYL